MKTQKNSLAFGKMSLVELTTRELNEVKGGTGEGQTTFACGDCVTRVTFTMAQ